MIGTLLTPLTALAADFQLPAGKAWTATRLAEVIKFTANFLISLGVVGAIISIVASGILYFTSGFNSKSVDKAKELFKNALLGTLIILAVGVIINTLSVLVTLDFFK